MGTLWGWFLHPAPFYGLKSWKTPFWILKSKKDATVKRINDLGFLANTNFSKKITGSLSRKFIDLTRPLNIKIRLGSVFSKCSQNLSDFRVSNDLLTLNLAFYVIFRCTNLPVQIDITLFLTFFLHFNSLFSLYELWLVQGT